MKALIALAVAVALIGLSQSAFAQDAVTQQCQARVSEYDSSLAQEQAEVRYYEDLIAAHKGEADTLIRKRQAAMGKIAYDLYVSLPTIRRYLEAVRQADTNPKQAAVAKLMRPDLISHYVNSPAIRDFEKAVSDLDARGIGIRPFFGSTLDFTINEVYDISGLRMQVNAAVYVMKIEERIHVIVYTSASSESLPRFNPMSTGMQIFDLDRGLEITSLDIPNWGGLKKKTILSEPFTQWLSSDLKDRRDEEPESVSLCRTILN